MKTLKNLLFVTVALISTAAFAQTTDLAVTVGSTYDITITQANVGIDMNTAAHFTGGNTTGVISDHIVVTASGAYTVEVIADGEFFTPGTGTDQIAVSNVLVETSNSGTNETSTATHGGALALDHSGTVELLATDGGDIAREYQAEYSIPANNAGNFLNVEATSYTATLTYSITPN